MYAHEWAGMLYKKYAEFYPNERLFHLNRSGSVGTQRYSIFQWSGDVSRSWSGFQAQLPLMLNMSLCGLGYISSDLGGFAAGEKDEELYTRWLQMGVFNPVFRPHGSGIPSEPIFFSEETQRIVRNSIKLRYRLMPYIYNAAAENSMTGRPIVKPLFYYHPDDARFTEYSEAYYFGDQMVVVPVIQRKATGKEIKLPEGMWYDFYTREMVEGPATINKELTMENIPVFVKAGSFIPMVNDFQTTDNYPHQNLQIHFYPQKMGESAQYSLFDDDGKDAKNLKTGNYRITNFESNHSDEELTINIKTQNNHYKAPRNEFLEWHIYALDKFPAALEVDGEKIPVFHILNKPAIMGIDAKYNPTNKELIIIMPRTQETMSMKIIK
jgi:oligosaccharide 4-alpha-D-glucosyltransferase